MKVKKFFYLTAFLYLSLFFSTDAHALEVKIVEINPECKKDPYNQGQFKFMKFFKDFIENVKKISVDDSTDLYDTLFGLSPYGLPDMNKKIDSIDGHFGSSNYFEQTQTIIGRSFIVEKYHKILFQYYHYHDGNPLLISRYTLEAFKHKSDSPVPQFSLRASAVKKNFPKFPPVILEHG